MRVNGEWRLCKDGEVRPCVTATIRLSETDVLEFPLLLDAGADRTVLSAQFLEWLRPFTSAPDAEAGQLTGIGGGAASLRLDLPIWFKRDTGTDVKINGPFSIFTDEANAEMSLLGRDVTNNFRVIYDSLDQTVILLAPPHRYEIKTN